MKWIQTIPQGPDRTKVLQTIYQGMKKGQASYGYNFEAVEAFAREYGLND
ncbi:MAG: hypothetical protein RI957_13 [Verrucomicrobiota bacterium]|jgi:hypothetical protein